MKYYDIHCHVFNKEVLSNRIVNVVLPLLELLDEEKEGTLLNIDKVEQVMERIERFLSAFLKDTSKDVFDVLDQAYNQEFSIIPLMFDLTYADDNDGNIAQDVLYKMRRENVIELLQDATKYIKSKIVNNDELVQKLTDLADVKDGFFKGIFNFREETFTDNNFEQQIADLENLAQNDRVLPFFGIDPRREKRGGESAVELIKKYVLANNAKFKGVKLYAPAGFSPTDQVLYDNSNNRECVYSLCQEHNIPITVHCSDAGFACTSRHLVVQGHVNLHDTVVYFDTPKRIKFKNKFFSFKAAKAIKERAEILNHPKLWEEVFKRYPKLTLNLAHFGGSGQIMKYVRYELPEKIKHSDFKDILETVSNKDYKIIAKVYKEGPTHYKLKYEIPHSEREKVWNILYAEGIIDNWTKAIYDIIRNPKYPNAFTDLSCFSEIDEVYNDITISHKLGEFKQLLYDKSSPYVKSKILYGSDFFFCLIFGPAIQRYIQDFKDVFADELQDIASVNAERFLEGN